MNTSEYISVAVFCKYYGVTPSFINSMKEFGLVEIILMEETQYIPLSQLRNVEKLTRLSTDLEINIEGIDVIVGLLARINEMQKEIATLKHRLAIYETSTAKV